MLLTIRILYSLLVSDKYAQLLGRCENIPMNQVFKIRYMPKKFEHFIKKILKNIFFNNEENIFKIYDMPWIPNKYSLVVFNLHYS